MTIGTHKFEYKYGDITFTQKILPILTNQFTYDLSKLQTSIKHDNWRQKDISE